MTLLYGATSILVIARAAGALLALAAGVSAWKWAPEMHAWKRSRSFKATPEVISEEERARRREAEEYSHLDSVIGGYFHQDWDYETDDTDAILAQIRDECSPEAVAALIQDFQRFVAAYGQSDAELTAAFERVFKPEADFYDISRMGSREGFRHAIEILSQPRRPAKCE